MKPQPIASAPIGDGWLLGYIPTLGNTGYVPWLPITWGDRGWMNDEGNTVEPSLWVRLPDPQPNPTGWRPPEGSILIEQITGEGWTCNDKPIEVPYRWMVYILREDGSYDEYRDTYHCVTYHDAERRAGKWQQQLGLPIKVTFLDPKVTPLFPQGTVQ